MFDIYIGCWLAEEVWLVLKWFDDFTLALDDMIPFYDAVEDVISLEFLSESRKFCDWEDARFALWED